MLKNVPKIVSLLKYKHDGSDAYRTLFEVIESRGFRPEPHQITTPDGYILTLHRIVNPLNGKGAPLKPVLLQHGFCGNSSSWIANTDDGYLKKGDAATNLAELKSGKMGNNLALELANIGYDVWAGNFRGNTYSRGHTRLDPTRDLQEYWSFSMDEMIKYDLPSSIGYILNETNSKNLAYVGMSMGTSTMFALLSTQQKFNDILKPFIAMAPCPFCESPINSINTAPKESAKTRSKRTQKLISYMEKGGPFRPPWVHEMAGYLATGHMFQNYTHKMIMKEIQKLVGYDESQILWDRIPAFLSHQNENFSRSNLLHFYQIKVSGRFNHFDFGRHRNIEVYGQESPPRYPLENISNNHMALVYSKKDKVGPLHHLKHLKEAINVSVFEDYAVPLDNFAHLDVQYGRDAGRYVYPKVVEILEKATA